MFGLLRKKKKKTVFIHIGFMKTGTSAIQQFLFNNDKVLENNNFFFPSINRRAMNDLGFSLLKKRPKHVHHTLNMNKVELYAELLSEIEDSNCDNIILSTEAFSLLSTEEFIGQNAPKALREIFDITRFDVKIIAFVRRQDDYVESQYNQHIKTHDFWKLCVDDIETFYFRKKELFNFNTLIKKWELYFDSSSIIIQPYDAKNNSVDQFLEIVGILDLKNQFNYTSDEVNKSLSFKSLEFMKLANQFDVIKDTAQQNYKLVDLIESTIGTKTKASLFSVVKKKEILLDFYQDNVELSKKYLNGNLSWINTKLIEEEVINDALTIEDCVRVSTGIWNYYQKKENE